MRDLSGAVFSEHSWAQMHRRGISEEEVRAVLSAPGQVISIRNGRIVAQGLTGRSDSSSRFLLRVFVDVDRRPPVVVTVYRTSKLGKYGSKA